METNIKVEICSERRERLLNYYLRAKVAKRERVDIQIDELMETRGSRRQTTIFIHSLHTSFVHTGALMGILFSPLTPNPRFGLKKTQSCFVIMSKT